MLIRTHAFARAGLVGNPSDEDMFRNLVERLSPLGVRVVKPVILAEPPETAA